MKKRNAISNKERVRRLGLKNDRNPVNDYHDIDEIIASPEAVWKRPWWVKTVDKPTMEVDWDNYERFDVTKTMQLSYVNYVGEKKNERLTKNGEKNCRKWAIENRPGQALIDRALATGANYGAVGTSFIGSWSHFDLGMANPFRRGSGSRKPKSFKDMGIPRYEGSHEENARLIRAVARFYGAAQVGFVELNENHQKLIYSRDGMDGKWIEFENVDQPYETKNKRVIPEKARWLIVFSVQMSGDMMKMRDGRVSTAHCSSPHALAYGQGQNIMESLQTFLYVLGYQGLSSDWYNGLGIAPALATVAGLGEIGRTNQLVSPEYGPHQRLFKLVTDLPLAVTKPIDAGILDFCRICKSCAQDCPSGSLSLETEPTWETVGPWHNPGHKTWFDRAIPCMSQWVVTATGCSTCYSVCPFGKQDKSFIHGFVKAVIARNPLFRDTTNRLMVFMDELFGYQDPKDIDAWWKSEFPLFGIPK